MNFKNEQLSGQTLVLKDDDANVLGPGLVLQECTVISECENQAIIIAGLTMTGGRFEQKRPLSNFHFERAHFRGVAFSGDYVGCDFGDWDSRENSSITNCTFANARLDGCRFLNCDQNSIEFPGWPCFTITNPVSAREYVLSQPWPSKLGIVLDIYTDTDPECVAVCGDAERIAKKNDISLEALHALLLGIPGAILTPPLSDVPAGRR